MTGPVQESKQGNGSAKKWLIGCGAALVLVVIVVVALAVGGGMFISSMSGGAVKEIFGEKQPAGYTAFGLPLGQKELKNMAFLMQPQSKRVVVALDTEANASDAKVLKSGDAKQIEAYVQRLASDAESSSAGSGSSKVSMDDIQLDGVQTIRLENGKDFPVVYGKVKDDGELSPSVVALLPEASGRLIVLFALDGQNTSTDPQADFKVQHKTLEADLKQIITETDLDDRLQ
jgi:hypothetical protein